MSPSIPMVFLFLSCAPLAPTDRVVAIQPLGPVDPLVVSAVAERIETVYAARVTVLPEQPLPSSAWYPARKRYRGAPLLERLAATAPAVASKVLGLTACDVSVAKPPLADWGVIGVAQLDRRAAVVSTYRLGRKGASRDRRARRARDVSVHELGHAFGLPHCPSRGCVMNDAHGRVATVDACTGEFCASCRARLGGALRSPVMAQAERPRERSRVSMRVAHIP
jgi:archaemetzincin